MKQIGWRGEHILNQLDPRQTRPSWPIGRIQNEEGEGLEGKSQKEKSLSYCNIENAHS